MERNSFRPVRAESASSFDNASRKLQPHAPNSDSFGGSRWEWILIRTAFAACCVGIGFHFHPFGLVPYGAALAGLAFSLLVFVAEWRLRRASLRRLIGASVGSILGILGAYLMNIVLSHTSMPEASRSFVGMALLLVMTYIGLVIGANKGEMLNLQAFGGVFGSEKSTRVLVKVVDTSVIIDGRIADICEAHFLDGTLIVPNFVLRELQMVADSADPLKRQRGRRGLEVLQRLQKMSHIDVQVVEDDFPQIAEVDLKLIELAKRFDSKIITNDFNLNKVATVHGLEVLNVNQLANALKPVVLPGESMRVFILREGKEYNQGVAYLDDGTMVVVDGARKSINKTVDITVTSVHQTTAGKMIFGRLDDRSEGPRAVPAAHTETARQEPPARSPEPPVTISERAPRPVFPNLTRE
ncbi:MAG TPA: PIN domain-containing protein [Candidatus Acidoferrum sp.]|nr:PIN domain-containing protein [Candidatus Acidoferrum sp.]